MQSGEEQFPPSQKVPGILFRGLRIYYRKIFSAMVLFFTLYSAVSYKIFNDTLSIQLSVKYLCS